MHLIGGEREGKREGWRVRGREGGKDIGKKGELKVNAIKVIEYFNTTNSEGDKS